MSSKVTHAISVFSFALASVIFVYSVYAAMMEDTDDKTYVKAYASLTYDTGGVTGKAEGTSKDDNNYGDMYLYAEVAGEPPESNQNPYWGKLTRNVTTGVGSNSSDNYASSVVNDLYHSVNNYASASVRGAF